MTNKSKSILVSSDEAYPIRITVEVMVTDGNQDGWVSGPEYYGHAPTDVEMLALVADALVMARKQIGFRKGAKFRIPTPSELMTNVARTKLGVNAAIIGAKQWAGFSEAELKAAIVVATKKKTESVDAD